MAKNANGKQARPEDDAPAVQRDLAELAVQIATLSSKRLDILAGMLSRADRAEHSQLLEEVEIRQKLRAQIGRGVDAGFLVLVAVAILVATVMRVSFLAARPFVGFGLLGAVLLLAGLRRWYRASEVRERMMMINADEPDDGSTDLTEGGDEEAEDGQRAPCRSSETPTGRSSPSSKITTAWWARGRGPPSRPIWPRCQTWRRPIPAQWSDATR